MKNQLQFFTSFEEMNEADAKERAAIPAIEHLQNVTERIKRIYAEELKKPMDKEIKFKDEIPHYQ